VLRCLVAYRIALDDFTWEPKFEPLVEMANYIKVDFIQTDGAGAARVVESPHRHRGCHGGGEGGEPGGVQASLRGGFHPVSGVLFLPPSVVEVPEDTG
jgi:hypothetical protein